MATELQVKCSASVPTDGMRLHYHPCYNRAKVTREGKPFCILHDPIRLNKLQAKRQKKWDEDWAKKQKMWERGEKERKVLKRLMTCPEWEISELVHKWRKLVS